MFVGHYRRATRQPGPHRRLNYAALYACEAFFRICPRVRSHITPQSVADDRSDPASARHRGGNTVPSWLPFPRTFRRDSRMEYKSWMCLICGWIYDEEAGLPEEGIAPGTRWEDVPINWTCPECGARKEDFEMVQI